MPYVSEFNDHRIDRKCSEVRERLLALHNHEQEMSKAEVLKLCRQIMMAMINIIEMLDE
jgi:hypothetical protein